MKQNHNPAPGEGKENIVPFIPDGDFYFKKGVDAFQKHKFDRAVKWLQKAIEEKPDNPLYQCQLSIIYTETGSYHTANQILLNVLETSGDSYVDCYYLLANNCAHLGQLHDAKEYAESYINKNPNGELREDAEQLMALVDNDDSDENDEESGQEDEQLTYHEMVCHHMERQEWDKALPLLEDMSTLFPEDDHVRHDYAYALFFAGYGEKALGMEQTWLEEDPESLHARGNLAVFYDARQQHDACQHHINMLRNVYPVQEQQKLRIAVTFAQTGQYDEAYTRFRSINDQQMDLMSYYKWYSTAAYQLEKPTKAFSIWEKGCERHPELADEKRPWDAE
ncbi:hypothetical protein GCM10008983_25390 [Lentibacillus halophilus]|uniref:Tetratricopeptide repeat-containing protein n=1 Tax=Lentibacillus halophilus TaxID=295065 RepID=A0ABP3J9U9_9BACI